MVTIIAKAIAHHGATNNIKTNNAIVIITSPPKMSRNRTCWDSRHNHYRSQHHRPTGRIHENPHDEKQNHRCECHNIP